MNVLTSISAHRRPTAPPTAAPIPCLYHRQHLNWATSLEVSAVLVLLFCKSNHTNLRMHSPPSRRIVVRRHHLQHPLYLYPVSATDNTSIGLDRLSAGRESRLNKVRRNGWYHYFYELHLTNFARIHGFLNAAAATTPPSTTAAATATRSLPLAALR